MSDPGGLEAIEPWIEGYLQKLTPAERTKVARKVGIGLRQSNSKRIRANIQPDGTAMEPRKPKKGRVKKDGTTRDERRKGRMFRKLGLLRSLRVRPTPDSVTVDFVRPMVGTATVHHFGLIDSVDRKRPKAPRVRYPTRQLLGFSPEDRQAIMDAVLKWVGD